MTADGLLQDIAAGERLDLADTAPEGAGSAWLGALLGEMVARRLPGRHVRWTSEGLSFVTAPDSGSRVEARAEVAASDGLPGDAAARRIALDCRCTDAGGQMLMHGRVVVEAAPAAAAGGGAARPHFLHDLVQRAAAFGPMRIGVVHPVDAAALQGMADAAAAGLIDPVVYAPRHKLEAAAEAAGIDLGGYDRKDVPHSHAAAEAAVAAVRDGGLAGLMKGSLHTDELMAAVVDRRDGLSTDRRISHAFCLDVPLYPRPLFVADAAINIAPDLMQKRDITRNTIDLAHAVGIAEPKVAILAAVETVNPRMSATLDAAALCKMADRGQIAGALLDGPLAFDNAVSIAAAQTKHIRSDVAGEADILIVPDIEAGNMVAKQLEYLAGAEAAGLVLGASVPIVLTSRADGPAARLASCALAVMLAHARAEGMLIKPMD